LSQSTASAGFKSEKSGVDSTISAKSTVAALYPSAMVSLLTFSLVAMGRGSILSNKSSARWR
jgi:hypothetical protein